MSVTFFTIHGICRFIKTINNVIQSQEYNIEAARLKFYIKNKRSIQKDQLQK